MLQNDLPVSCDLPAFTLHTAVTTRVKANNSFIFGNILQTQNGKSSYRVTDSLAKFSLLLHMSLFTPTIFLFYNRSILVLIIATI